MAAMSDEQFQGIADQFGVTTEEVGKDILTFANIQRAALKEQEDGVDSLASASTAGADAAKRAADEIKRTFEGLASDASGLRGDIGGDVSRLESELGIQPDTGAQLDTLRARTRNTPLSNDPTKLKERLGLYGQEHDLIMQNLQEQVKAEEDSARAKLDAANRHREALIKTKEIGEQLVETVNSFRMDRSVTNLNNREIFSLAEKNFKDTLAKAKSGDQDAVANLGGSLKTFLDENKKFNASAGSGITEQALADAEALGVDLANTRVSAQPLTIEAFSGGIDTLKENALQQLEALDGLVKDTEEHIGALVETPQVISTESLEGLATATTEAGAPAAEATTAAVTDSGTVISADIINLRDVLAGELIKSREDSNARLDRAIVAVETSANALNEIRNAVRAPQPTGRRGAA